MKWVDRLSYDPKSYKEIHFNAVHIPGSMEKKLSAIIDDTIKTENTPYIFAGFLEELTRIESAYAIWLAWKMGRHPGIEITEYA